nr:unnamed protein product [Callosobruchus analis]
MVGKKWYVPQRFGDNTGFAPDGCFEALAPLSAARPDLTINFPVNYLDEKKNRQEITYVSNIIGLQSKYYIRHNNTDFLLSDFVVTGSYMVTEVCNMNAGTCKCILNFLQPSILLAKTYRSISNIQTEVLIFVSQKNRDEELIKKATEEASKIINLPSPSIRTDFTGEKKPQQTTYLTYIIGLRSKYYIRHNNTDFLLSDFVVTGSYMVSEICNMNAGTSEVLIFVSQKERDEELIAKATEEASKIVNLPSPSIRTDCEGLPS